MEQKFRALRNDGAVTPESLHEYVYFKVASRMDQIPKLKGDKSSSFILAKYPKLALSPVEEEFELDFREVPDSMNVALVIGIDAWYEKGGASITSYPSAKKNCQSVYKVLKGLGYGIYGDKAVLASELDKQHGSLMIQKTIHGFFKKINSGQSAIFYFVGPILTDQGILCTGQTDLESPEIGGIPMQYIQSSFRFSMSRQTLFIFECFPTTILKGKEKRDIHDFKTEWTEVTKYFVHQDEKVSDSFHSNFRSFHENIGKLLAPHRSNLRQSHAVLAFAETSGSSNEKATPFTEALIEVFG